MMLWIVFALMIAAALLAVLWPLRRAKIADAAPPGSGDVAVYRDQLEEVERDREAGTIGAPEAEAARLEVSRRLIGAAEAQAAASRETPGDPPPRRRQLAALSVVVALPLGAAALYLVLGSPDLPGQPLAARMAQAHGGDRSVEALFARVETHLAEHPEDGRGWEVIAPVYMRLGRYEDAAKARANALRLLGATAERYAYVGEALVAAANGIVTPEAKAAFDEAIRLDPTDVTARFYQGLAAEQAGDREAAARIWRALLADAPPEGARWPDFVRKALARLESPTTATPAAQPAAGADPIRGMVERLAARLQKDGSDVEGWIQLVRSYKVLEDTERARAAIADARRALAGDPDKLRRLEEGLKALETNASVAPPPPTANAAPPAGQDPMIRGMVDRLAARLQKDGSDVEGWIQLVRSYKVLEDAERTRAAIADARRVLAGDPDKLRRFEEGLKEIEASASVATPPPSANAAPPAPGPDPMIRGMVDRLAARLQKDGSDVEGWIQLVRSYKVLEDAERTRAAIADARRVLAGDPDKLRRFEEGLKEIEASASVAAPAPPPSANAAPPAPGPDPMIRGMVDRLAARLQKDGSDVDGWVQLVRSYKVLGEADRVRDAISDARRALAGDPDKLHRLEDGIKSLGVEG